MSLIEKVRELNLPFGQYVVVASGILDVLGLRTANDIDIAVTEELHTTLRATGEWQEDIRYEKVFLTKPGVEIIPRLDWEEYPSTTEQVIGTATVIDGIPFMNLQELKKFKLAQGRSKDLDDIELIDEYLKD